MSESRAATEQFDLENKHFQRAFEAIENTKECILITGKAGTGKSTLLRQFCAQTKKKFIVLAPTGIAAINAGGVTIHSFFRFPFRPLLEEDEEITRFHKYSDKVKMIQKLDLILIDEISMVRADIIDAIDYSLRINGGNPDLPFGGKQIVFFGDLFQLEPVSGNTAVEQQMFNEHYNSHYFFSASVFRRVYLHCLELTKVYRQNDAEFISLLNRIRSSAADHHDIELINSRFDPAKEASEFTITLCTTNYIASGINDYELNRIPGDSVQFMGKIEGDFNERMLPTDYVLDLKPGAQVVFIKNSASSKWVNGTIAKIHKLEKDAIEVLLPDGGIVTVEKDSWENKTYRWDHMLKKIRSEVLGRFEQYPLKLAWAITIHKSQGLTFDKVIVELGNGAFAHGHLYVALSRCRTMEGIVLRSRIREKDIIVDERVVRFAKQFSIIDV